MYNITLLTSRHNRKRERDDDDGDTVLLKDKDLSTGRLVYKSVPDEKYVYQREGEREREREREREAQLNTKFRRLYFTAWSK